MADENKTIPPPPGFTLDAPPAPPEGFTLDVPPPPEGFVVDGQAPQAPTVESAPSAPGDTFTQLLQRGVDRWVPMIQARTVEDRQLPRPLNPRLWNYYGLMKALGPVASDIHKQ